MGEEVDLGGGREGGVFEALLIPLFSLECHFSQQSGGKLGHSTHKPISYPLLFTFLSS